MREEKFYKFRSGSLVELKNRKMSRQDLPAMIFSRVSGTRNLIGISDYSLLKPSVKARLPDASSSLPANKREITRKNKL